MNGEDQFKERLQRQPQRQIPPAWREEILHAARQAAAHCPQSPVGHGSLLSTIHSQLSTFRSLRSTLNHQLSTLLWPHPKAWAGLATAWLLVLVLDFAAREPSTQEVARRTGPPSAQLRQMLHQQEQLLAELVGPIDRPETRPPKPAVPQPRSQRREEFMNA